MPQLLLQPRPGPRAYAYDQDSGESVPGLTGGRWPIWLGRFALLAVLAVVGPRLWEAFRDVEGRESLVMSVLALTVVWAVFLLWAHEAINQAGKCPRTRIMKAALTFGASCVTLGLFLAGTQADATHAPAKVARVQRSLAATGGDPSGLAIHDDHLDLLPRFSARMTGAAQAPVSLIFLGSGADLLQIFAASGWHAADRITPRTALRAFGRGVLNRPYHQAPVFPSFLDGKLHDVAFQQTTPGGSSRRRHHARWWLTDFTCGGRPVWAATASYDAGVGVGRLFPMPIHHIDPDIDAERDYIVRSLTATGLVRLTQQIRVTEPMVGKNAAGDRFYTGGMAFVLA